MPADYRQQVRERVLDDAGFVRAVFSGTQRGQILDWAKVVVRPVVLRETRHLQFSYFTATQDITKNYTGDEAQAHLDELLARPFQHIQVESARGQLQVRVTKKGRATVHRSPAPSGPAAPAAPAAPALAHDHVKQKLVSADSAAPFLQAVGILTQDGKIRADMQRKFKQINEFLRLLDEAQPFTDVRAPLRVVDFGCGNAYLTFATYHYLNERLGLTAHVVGVDVQAHLLARHREKAAALGWERLTFESGRIADYQPETPPDVVVALHACDTATDDALAKGIAWESRLIVAAPCCQHELQQQLGQAPTPAPFHLMARYGILNERLGDVLTDTFRASILRLMGYRTDVMQFVSTEHTAKNLMIRAVKSWPAGHRRLAEEYQALKDFWHVTPYLEGLLDGEHAQWLQPAR